MLGLDLKDCRSSGSAALRPLEPSHVLRAKGPKSSLPAFFRLTLGRETATPTWTICWR